MSKMSNRQTHRAAPPYRFMVLARKTRANVAWLAIPRRASLHAALLERFFTKRSCVVRRTSYALLGRMRRRFPLIQHERRQCPESLPHFERRVLTVPWNEILATRASISAVGMVPSKPKAAVTPRRYASCRAVS